MMRIQYDSMIKKMLKMVDDELEMDTREGVEVFIALTDALFDFHPDVIAAKKRNEMENGKDKSHSVHCLQQNSNRQMPHQEQGIGRING